jgi:hypothetical protein
MLTAVFDLLFGCRHPNYSFPITAKKRSTAPRIKAAHLTGTYVVCLKCGKEFPYDWQQMKILAPEPEGATLIPSEAAPLASNPVTGFKVA